jgi:hypothetical protein
VLFSKLSFRERPQGAWQSHLTIQLKIAILQSLFQANGICFDVEFS